MITRFYVLITSFLFLLFKGKGEGVIKQMNNTIFLFFTYVHNSTLLHLLMVFFIHNFIVQCFKINSTCLWGCTEGF
jgi:hypothetical protein